MGIQKGDKDAIAAAAVRVSKRSNSHITEVIEPETEDGKSLPVADRFAAAGVVFFVGGACYFAAWLWILFNMSRVEGPTPIDRILLSWHTPALVTLATVLSAFAKPRWTYRIFGKLMKPFVYMFMFWN
ncbi:MAG TPA: hypothetical protein VGT99_13550 [Gammaproteobacteria bacterium]|nr:hypothetical protein [Gammaproteobacteria bacterium]